MRNLIKVARFRNNYVGQPVRFKFQGDKDFFFKLKYIIYLVIWE